MLTLAYLNSNAWTKDISKLCSYKQVSEKGALTEGALLSAGVKNGVKSRGYMKLNMPVIPKGAVLTKAELNLDVSGTTKKKLIAYYAEGKNLDNLEKLTWKNQPFGKDITNVKAVDFCGNDNGTLDITKAAKKWYLDDEASNCLMFAIEDEKECSDAVKFVNLIHKGGVFLEVTYKNFTGIENYWSTHCQTAGNAGTGSINDYTGKLTFVHEDASSSGIRMPVTVQHAYSQDYESKDTGRYGNGWILSTESTLKIPSGYADINKYPYVYTDSDGTEHYFKEKKSVIYYLDGKKKTAKRIRQKGETYCTAQDEDGLGLFVVPVSEKDFKDKYPLMITNRAGTLFMYFDRNGYLGLVRDSKYDADLGGGSDDGGGIIIIGTKKEKETKGEYNGIEYSRKETGKEKASEELKSLGSLKTEIEKAEKSS